MTGQQPIETEISGLKVKARPLKHAQSKPLLPDITEFVFRLIKALATLIGTDLLADVPATQGAALDTKRLPGLLASLRKLDVEKLLDRLDPAAARGLMDILIRNDTTLLSATTVVMPDPTGELANFELAKDKDRNAVFDEHPEAYVAILLFAGRVTYERFFPGIARRASATPSESS